MPGARVNGPQDLKPGKAVWNDGRIARNLFVHLQRQEALGVANRTIVRNIQSFWVFVHFFIRGGRRVFLTFDQFPPLCARTVGTRPFLV